MYLSMLSTSRFRRESDMTNAELSRWGETLYVLVMGPESLEIPQDEWEFYDTWEITLHQELRGRKSGVGTK